MRLLTIVAARPNFMKMAPVHQALVRHGHDVTLVHTGQHYDANMSQVFFEELGMPKPEVNLQVGSASHAVQTARIMEAFEPVVLERKPDWVVVAGDVNSTLACALVAAKLGVRVAHLEAGLRSFDRTMPEETNRVVVDHVSDLLLTPSPDADENLRKEGIAAAKIHFVGNAMIDSLLAHKARAEKLPVVTKLGLKPGGYALVTLHRPRNVDTRESLAPLIEVFTSLAKTLPVVFPIHPRTRAKLDEFKLDAKALKLIEPLGYLEFLALQAQAKMVLTDSGGIQEETTALGVPCLTLRDNTERPITVSEGTNTVVGLEPARIMSAAQDIVKTGGKRGRVPALWDGKAGERVAAVFDKL